jgi:hypothetical protein
MMLFVIDGTITYRQGAEAIPVWEFELDTHFSDGVAERIEAKHLERLQQRFSGDLNVERLPTGNMRITRTITALGPESACRQADDLRCALYRYLGLHVNIARPL